MATLAVKKGSKFTDPDAQFPRGGALACARGLYPFSIEVLIWNTGYFYGIITTYQLFSKET